MTNLDCNVVNCAHNENDCCKLSSIGVLGEDAKSSSSTCCGSFYSKSCGNATNQNREASKSTEVSCEAKDCKYNSNLKCSAKHIGISGGHADKISQTECASFECN